MTSTAELHALSKEQFPSDLEFWTTWALCPQLINLKILRRHFTAHTWLNWSMTIGSVNSIVSMVLRPRRHIREIPGRTAQFIVGMGFMWVSEAIFSKEFRKFPRPPNPEAASRSLILGWVIGVQFEKFSSYLRVAGTVGSAIQLFSELQHISALGRNPLRWEEELERQEANAHVSQPAGAGLHRFSLSRQLSIHRAVSIE